MVDFPSRRELFKLPTAPLMSLAFGSIAFKSPSLPADETTTHPKSPFTSVKDFGAVGDGVADDSAAVAQAYDSLKTTGGTLFFPRGHYRLALELTSRNIHLAGEGRGASILSPVVPGGTIIRALYREGSWDAVHIGDLTLIGVGKNEGSGFVAGADMYQHDDEYTGVTFFNRTQFVNLDKCIARPFGSIGLWIDGCQFGSANYHIWAKGNLKGLDRDAMHAGCVVVSRCHMDYFAKAMFYLDSSGSDCGQIIFENNIFESGPGFVIYIRNFYSSGATPGMVFRSNWNENTATATNLVVEAKRHSNARFLYAENATSAIRFDDTPIGPCELVASGLQTDNCSLQNLTSFKADKASTALHDRARMFSGTSVGRVRSIAHPVNSEGLRTPWFRMAPPRQMPASFEGQEVLTITGDQKVTLRGDPPSSSSMLPNSSVLKGGAVQRLAIKSSQNMPLSTVAHIRGSGWLVTCYLYKMLSESKVELQVNGTRGVSGLGDLSSMEWELLVNISKFDFSDTEAITVYHRALDKSSFLVAGITMRSFQTLQQATNFANMLTP